MNSENLPELKTQLPQPPLDEKDLSNFLVRILAPNLTPEGIDSNPSWGHCTAELIGGVNTFAHKVSRQASRMYNNCNHILVMESWEMAGTVLQSVDLHCSTDFTSGLRLEPYGPLKQHHYR